MKIRVVELFAGVGGFRVGLEQASKDFETVWANQWEPNKTSQHAYDCYKYHFEKKGGVNKHTNQDIHEAKNFCPDVDLVVGGFPCQDYSVAATGAKGIEGKKGVLWWDIRDLLENKRPSYVLLENVDRLLKSPAKQRGRDFGIILKSLNDLGYAVEWRVVNAADYGCVQRRRRTFIFAYHQNTNFYETVHNERKKDIILRSGFFHDVFKGTESKDKASTSFNFDDMDDLYKVSNKFKAEFRNSGVCINGTGLSIEIIPTIKPFKTLSQIVEREEVNPSYFLSSEDKKKFKYLRGAKKILRTKPNGEEYLYSEGAMSPYDSLDLPARTMLTSEGSTNRSTHIIKDPNTNKFRKLTPLECERINGFPDNWTNTGMPQKFRYFCMGNALVVPLIKLMGKKINRIATQNQE